jgi:hypothetical protein
MKKLNIFASLLFCLPAFADDAPMFRGNLQHTGVYNAAGIPKFSKVKWKFKVNGYALSSPAVVGGTAY